MSSAPVAAIQHAAIAPDLTNPRRSAQAHAARRPALDGLRALAVTAVVVYHFGNGSTSWLPGGFLGVDVFFVLSGYLITGLLLAEYARHDRIDLLGFWVRRVRRLFPALVLMLLVVSGWIWWVSPPEDYPMRRADIFWTVGYLANWHLIHTSETYFAAYTAVSPVRHTWSLAVEEQFYLVWPVLILALLWVGRRWLGRISIFRGLSRVRRTHLPVIVVAVFGICYSASWMADKYDPLYPSHDYYSTQGRVQELFVGVVLAVLAPWLRRRAGRFLAIAVAVGLVGLLAAICRLPDNTVFFYTGGALLICVATAALIAGLESYPDGALAKAFSWRPAVALGRISYGVYLWHWPIVVAFPVDSGMPMRIQAIRQLLRLVLTLAFSIASYFLVEQPILRSRRMLGSPLRVFAAAAAGCATVVVVALAATALPGTISQQLSMSSDTACPGERSGKLMSCTWPIGTNTSTHPVRLALLGDSTGRALGPGLNDWATKTGSTWLDAAWKLCTSSNRLILGGPNSPPDLAAQACHNQAPVLIDAALRKYHPPVVLVSEYWAHNRYLLVDGKELKPGTPEHDAALRAGYLALVDQVASYGGRVVFLELPPPGKHLGTAVATGRPAGHDTAPVYDGQYVAGFNTLLRSVAAARPTSASTVSVTDVICPNGTCGPLSGQTVIRYDGVHYSIPFARYLVPIVLHRIGLT